MKTPVYVDLWYSSTWNDITSDVRSTPEHQIMISGGQQNWLSRVSPTKCDLALINTIVHPGESPTKIGKYSSRNPTSPLYRLIGRNTPLRVYVRWLMDDFGRTVASGWGTSASHLDGNRKETALVGSLAWTATGSGTGSSAVGSGAATHTQTTANGIRLSYLASGANIRDCEVRAVVTADEANIDGGQIEPANLVLRLIDANNYYYVRVQVTTAEVVQIGLRKIVAGVDSQIAAPVTVAGLTYSGQQLGVAFLADGPHLAAKVWAVSAGEAFAWQITATDTSLPAAGAPGVRSGVASGSTDVPVTFTYDNFEVRNYRFTGEVEAFPQEWTLDADEDGNGVVWAPLVAYGLMYRLGLPGQDVLAQSALRRWYSQVTPAPVAYWSLEDPKEATVSLADIGPPMRYRGQAVAPGQDLAPVGASSAVSIVGGTLINAFPDTALSSYIEAVGIGLPAPAELVVDGWFALQNALSAPPDVEGVTVSTFVSQGRFGSGVSYVLMSITKHPLAGVGQFDIQIVNFTFSTSATVTVTNSAAAQALDGLPHNIRFSLVQNGANVDVDIFVDGGSAGSGTATNANLPNIDSANPVFNAIWLDTAGQPQATAGATITHYAIWDDTAAPSPYEAGIGYDGETADARVTRVCDEEGIEAFVFGAGQAMGPQPIAPPLEMFIGGGEARDVDVAVFGEPRHTLGFSYTANRALINQDPTLTLDYASGDVAPPLLHREDLDHCKNDVIVTRRDGGSSARILQQAGSLNVNAPHTDPNGVGHYPVRPELNLASDTELDDIALWLRFHGTTDGLRFAALGVDLTALYRAGKTNLIGDVLAVDPGDMIVVENVPAWLGSGDTQQIHRGFSELLGPFHWVTENVTEPYGPYDIGTYGANVATATKRYDSRGSTLAAPVLSGTATSLQVTIAAGHPLWTLTAGNWVGLQVESGGVIWAVTSITGSASPQTINVTQQPVNGVIKVVPFGTRVLIAPAQRAAYGL